MLSLEDFVDAIKDELGDVEQLVRDEQFIKWVNRGRARLGITLSKRGTITWESGAAYAALPSDFERLDAVRADSGYVLPPYVLVANTGDSAAPSAPFYLEFLDPDSVSAGSAAVFYGGTHPDVTGTQDSTMPPLADEAVVSYALARFFRRIAATRADFTRYVAITGQNGIDVADLLDIASVHDRDFETARSELTAAAPATFYSD